MLRPALFMLLGAASAGCGLAAVGLVLYGQGPSAMAAVQLFGGIGFVVGLLNGGLHHWKHGRRTLGAATLPPEALAGLVRATVAGIAASRATARPPAHQAAALPPEPQVKATQPRSFAGSAFGA